MTVLPDRETFRWAHRTSARLDRIGQRLLGPAHTGDVDERSGQINDIERGVNVLGGIDGRGGADVRTAFVGHTATVAA